MPMRYESARLKALQTLELLDTPPEAAFDSIAAGARHLFGCKAAYIALIDGERQWFKAQSGTPACETRRDISFCDRVVGQDGVMIVQDALADPRFADNPLVLGPPFVRFYAGVPLRARAVDDDARLPVGTLCVIDDQPRDASPDQIEMLKGMALVVEALFELRRATRESALATLRHHQALIDMDRMRRQLTHAERMANIGSWRLDLATNRVDWSETTYAIHGLLPSDGEALNTALDFFPPPDRARVEQAVTACVEHGRPYDLEVDFTDARGRLRRVRAIGEAEVQDGRRVALIGVLQDVTSRYRMEQALRETAQTDELTRIASRRGFNASLDTAIADALGGGEPLAVALLDLDCFKQVNDKMGHAAGDEVLRVMAAKLRAADWLGDHVAARLGGDEFVLLLRGAAADQELVAGIERLLADLRHMVHTPDGPLTVTATIGACRLAPPPAQASRSLLLKAADQALYRAKKVRRGTGAIAGRDGFVTPRGEGPGVASAA